MHQTIPRSPASKSLYHQMKYDALTGVACVSASSTSAADRAVFKTSMNEGMICHPLPWTCRWGSLDIAHDSPLTIRIRWGMINTPCCKLTRGHQRRWTQHYLLSFCFGDSARFVAYGRNVLAEEYSWNIPEEWRAQDEYGFYQREVRQNFSRLTHIIRATVREMIR